MVELTILPRPEKARSAKQLAHDELIPFVMYAKGKENHLGVVKKVEIAALLRNIRSGFLPTTRITLKDEAGKTSEVLVKDIQYHPTTYAVIHLDFLELSPSQRVNINVPVEVLNQVDCVGIKMGGFMRRVMRHIPVRCLPKDIPSHFDVDALSMDIGHVRRVKDLVMPKGVTSLAKENDIVVTVAKRT